MDGFKWIRCLHTDSFEEETSPASKSCRTRIWILLRNLCIHVRIAHQAERHLFQS